MNALPTIAARGLVKRVRVGSEARTVVGGVDLDVHPSELFLVLGRSGSGKTTLLSILGGLICQDEGQVRVLGHDLETMDPGSRRAFVRRDIGLVFQAAGLIPGLNAIENVALSLQMLGESGSEVERRAREAL